MQHDPRSASRSRLEQLRASLLMLGAGLTVLFFLIAIDRPHWFRLKPATGTAVALSQAADARAVNETM